MYKTFIILRVKVLTEVVAVLRRIKKSLLVTMKLVHHPNRRKLGASERASTLQLSICTSVLVSWQIWQVLAASSRHGPSVEEEERVCALDRVDGPAESYSCGFTLIGPAVFCCCWPSGSILLLLKLPPANLLDILWIVVLICAVHARWGTAAAVVWCTSTCASVPHDYEGLL